MEKAAGIDCIDIEAVACTGFEDEFSPKSLCRQFRDLPKLRANGWLTPRFALFPQCVVFRFVPGSCRLRQIQLVCNEVCVPSEICFYAGVRPPVTGLPVDGKDQSAEPTNFHKLGFFKIPNSAQKTAEGRVMYTLHVDVEAEYIKLQIRSCHLNIENLYNQAGIVSFTCIGSVINHDEKDSLWAQGAKTRIAYGLESSPLYPGLDPNYAAVYGLVNQLGTIPALATPYLSSSVADKEMNDLMQALERAKALAVQTENYVDAGRLKHLLQYLQDVSAQISKLHLAKVTAAQEENYDVAESLRTTIIEIKRSMWHHICSNHASVYQLLQSTNSIPSIYAVQPAPYVSLKPQQALQNEIKQIESNNNSKPTSASKTTASNLVAENYQTAQKQNKEPFSLSVDENESKAPDSNDGKVLNTNDDSALNSNHDKVSSSHDDKQPDSSKIFASLERLNKSLGLNYKSETVDSNSTNSYTSKKPEGLNIETVPTNQHTSLNVEDTRPSTDELKESNNLDEPNLDSKIIKNQSTESKTIRNQSTESKTIRNQSTESNTIKKQMPDSGIDYDSIADPFKSARISEDTPLKAPSNPVA